MQTSGSLILVPSLGILLFFCWLGLFNFNMIVFVLSYIFFCYVLLSLRSLFFSNKKQKGSGFGGEEKWEGREGKAIIRIYCIRRESIFKRWKDKDWGDISFTIFLITQRISNISWSYCTHSLTPPGPLPPLHLFYETTLLTAAALPSLWLLQSSHSLLRLKWHHK